MGVLAAAPLGAQAHLVGLVRDTSGRALADAQVLLESTTIGARTDSNGTFRLSAEPARYVLLVRHLGHAPVRRTVALSAGDTIRTVVSLVPETPELDPVEVTGDRDFAPGRAGFAYRRRLGFGTFIDSTELRRNESRQLSSLLRKVRGLRIVRGPARVMGGMPKEWAAHPVGGCYVSVMLDNVFIYRGLRGEEPPDLRKEIPVMDLEAIEFYRGGGPIPTEFSVRHADCGLLVLWTRRGRIGG